MLKIKNFKILKTNQYIYFNKGWFFLNYETKQNPFTYLSSLLWLCNKYHLLHNFAQIIKMLPPNMAGHSSQWRLFPFNLASCLVSPHHFPPPPCHHSCLLSLLSITRFLFLIFHHCRLLQSAVEAHWASCYRTFIILLSEAIKMLSGEGHG